MIVLVDINSIADTILNSLATAFGGVSQIPNAVIGLAIAGQINNNGLHRYDAVEIAQAISSKLLDHSTSNTSEEDFRAIIKAINDGLEHLKCDPLGDIIAW